MKLNTSASALFSLAILGVGSVFAQTTATTIPVGFNSVTCLKNSDTYLSVPFCQSIDFQNLVLGTPSVGGGSATISPQAGTFTAGQFTAVSCFVRILSGTKAGNFYVVTANTTNSITVDLAGDDFLGVANGDGFMVCKFWTLATLLPPATQTTIITSASTSGSARRTELLLADMTTAGVNLTPNKKYFINAGVWKESVTGFPVSDNVVLLPDGYFVVRHNSAASAAMPPADPGTVYTCMGTVELNPVAAPLATLSTGKQDNSVSTQRPVPIKLKDLDLISSGAFVGSASTAGSARRDELLVYDNTVPIINRSSSATYFYNTGTSNWRSSATGFPVADDVEIPPSSGMIIRKFTSTGFPVIWTHTY